MLRSVEVPEGDIVKGVKDAVFYVVEAADVFLLRVAFFGTDTVRRHVLVGDGYVSGLRIYVRVPKEDLHGLCPAADCLLRPCRADYRGMDIGNQVYINSAIFILESDYRDFARICTACR